MEKEIYMIIIEEGGAKMPKINRSNISVVIRTRNEERWIGHTIQSLLDHLIQPEIIIVDNMFICIKTRFFQSINIFV